MFFKATLYTISLFIFHFCLHKSASGNTKIFLPAHNKLLYSIPKGLDLTVKGSAVLPLSGVK